MKEFGGNLIKVSVDNRRFFQPLDIKDHQSISGFDPDRRYRYLEATPGEACTISVRLLDPNQRYMVGIAVDGRDVVDGKKIPDDFHRADAWRGAYIFNVGTENGGTIKGWRESNSHVREFVFVEQQRSYTAEMFNDFSAVGTIVLAVFREDISAPISRGGMNSRGLGMGVGVRVESHVRDIHFVPRQTAYEIFVIKYATKAELQKIGVWTPHVTTKNRIWPNQGQKQYCHFPS